MNLKILYITLGILSTELLAAQNQTMEMSLEQVVKIARNIMRSKYLMFIPVTALLILFSNCTNTGKEESTEEKAEVKYIPTEVKPDTVDIANAV